MALKMAIYEEKDRELKQVVSSIQPLFINKILELEEKNYSTMRQSFLETLNNIVYHIKNKFSQNERRKIDFKVSDNSFKKSQENWFSEFSPAFLKGSCLFMAENLEKQELLDQKTIDFINLNTSFHKAYKTLDALAGDIMLVKGILKSEVSRGKRNLKVLRGIKKDISNYNNDIKAFYSKDEVLDKGGCLKRLEFYFSLMDFYVQTNGNFYFDKK